MHAIYSRGRVISTLHTDCYWEEFSGRALLGRDFLGKGGKLFGKCIFWKCQVFEHLVGGGFEGILIRDFCSFFIVRFIRLL